MVVMMAAMTDDYLVGLLEDVKVDSSVVSMDTSMAVSRVSTSEMKEVAELAAAMVAH